MLSLGIRARPDARLLAAWTCGCESALRNRQRGRPVAKTAVAVVAGCPRWGGRRRPILRNRYAVQVFGAFSQTNSISLQSMRMRTLSCYSESGAEPYGAVGAVGRWDRWPGSNHSAPTRCHAARRGNRARPAALPEAAVARGLGGRHRTRLRHREASLRPSAEERRRWAAEVGSTAWTAAPTEPAQRSLTRPTSSVAAARTTRRLCTLVWSATASVHRKAPNAPEELDIFEHIDTVAPGVPSPLQSVARAAVETSACARARHESTAVGTPCVTARSAALWTTRRHLGVCHTLRRPLCGHPC